MNTHPCSVPGCGRTVTLEKLMCWYHWRQVPSMIQASVYGAWRKYQAGRVPIEELRAVQARATAAVEALEGGVR